MKHIFLFVTLLGIAQETLANNTVVVVFPPAPGDKFATKITVGSNEIEDELFFYGLSQAIITVTIVGDSVNIVSDDIMKSDATKNFLVERNSFYDSLFSKAHRSKMEVLKNFKSNLEILKNLPKEQETFENFKALFVEVNIDENLSQFAQAFSSLASVTPGMSSTK